MEVVDLAIGAVVDIGELASLAVVDRSAALDGRVAPLGTLVVDIVETVARVSILVLVDRPCPYLSCELIVIEHLVSSVVP